MTNLFGYSIVSTTELKKQQITGDVLLASAKIQQKLLIEQENYIKTLESVRFQSAPDCGCHKSDGFDWFETICYALLFVAIIISLRKYYLQYQNQL